ncbi:MAG: tetratricopeptide repeat protein, partial [Phycisphaerae bacterium]
RREDWSKLPEMLAYLGSEGRDEVFANSLIRLLRNCDDERKWPALLTAIKDPSPLIRASAAEAMNGRWTPDAIEALLNATRDEYRLVRVRAAGSLAALPGEMVKDADRKDLDRATAEFLQVMTARPDDHASHYNLGNFFMCRRDFGRAIASFETAVKLQPDSIPPLVNISLAYNATGQNEKAEQALRQALKQDPNNAAANLNLGLLLAELGRMDEAEPALRAAFKAEPRSAVAAYNLGVMLAEKHPDEAVDWCRKAFELRPQEAKYAYTYAFYLRRKGETEQAIDVLQGTIKRGVSDLDVYALLADIYEGLGRRNDAADVYHQALRIPDLPEAVQYRLAERIQSLRQQ